MGKAQSKRSVDITTETKKGIEDEITEKMEKIEDVVINGDATVSEKSDPEKNEMEELENDKDMTTEKDLEANGDTVEPQGNAEAAKKEGYSATAEDISPLAEENVKKSKKEKVKKKWSFRSISFGKKDKQKPAKSEEGTEEGTNRAETEEKAIIEPENSLISKSSNENGEINVENHENGSVTLQEIIAEQNKENNSNEKCNDIISKINNIATETCVSVQNEVGAVSTELSEKTENTDIINESIISDKTTVDDASKNVKGINEKINCTETQNTDITSSFETPMENNITKLSSTSANGEVNNQIHLNGDDNEIEHQLVEKSKAQFEVNSNTHYKVSAATLDSIPTTSINPNAQIHFQNFHASSEMLDKLIQINNDEYVLKSPTEKETLNAAIYFSNEVEDDKNKVSVSALALETLSSEKLFEQKLTVDLSPPPLPISPPPSQVSVFMFANKNEDLQTKNCGSINFNPKENEAKNIPSPLNNTSRSETLTKGETNTTLNEMAHEKAIHDEAVEINGEKVIKNDEDETKIFNEIEVLNIKGTHVNVAAAVINEVTEAAAAILNNEFIDNGAQIMDGQSLQNNEKIRQDESVNENIILKHTIKTKQTNKEHIDFQEFKSEITNNLKQSKSYSEKLDNDSTECFLDKTNSIQPYPDEMISFRKSENLDEEHIDSVKEFSTATDIKDNAIVAELTQDFSVTCE